MVILQEYELLTQGGAVDFNLEKQVPTYEHLNDLKIMDQKYKFRVNGYNCWIIFFDN